jgi:2,4-dienoyl-CoA reductase-like NADH-dependent reductase (Old Yellow Enzyme family)
MSILFSPLTIRGIEFKNRIGVSPMCQYSSVEGVPTDWHFVHLGSRAVGGAALVVAEATAVSPEGRISPDDAGIWNEKQAEAYKRITAFITSQYSVPGIQLAHAGRKASTYSPWKGNGEVKPGDGGWQTMAPTALPYADNYPRPAEMSKDQIGAVVGQFREAAERSVRAGFKVVEIHMAHGYLIHEFLSPHSNRRDDEYGGNLQNRCRFAVEVAAAVRRGVPETVPVFARISSTDWCEGGWDVGQSIHLAKLLKEAGVDLIDCSSGGNVHGAVIPAGPGYQISFAERIKREAGVRTAAIGFITSPEQAEQIVRTEQADLVFLAREMLRNPYWPLYAAKQLKAEIAWPRQYLRAK